MLTDAEIAKMPDEEKAALLHSLMKHYTGPTEGMVASLTSRLEGLQDLLGEPEPKNIVSRQVSEARAYEESMFITAVGAMNELGHDLTIMYQHAAKTIHFATEVIAVMAAKKTGVELPQREAPCLPGTSAAAPRCSPSPNNEMEPCDDETL